MGLAGLGGAVDHALGSGFREPARVGRVGFRDEFGRPLLIALYVLAAVGITGFNAVGVPDL